MKKHPLRTHIEMISPLSNEEFEFILSHFVNIKIKKHAFLIQEGNSVKYEYYVLNGCLKAAITDAATGKEFVYQFAAEDWWVTDREAFFNRTVATVNINALEDSDLLAITLADREKLGAAMWKFEHFLAVKANLGYTSLQKRLQLMIMGSVKERYEHFLQHYPKLSSRIPKIFIASYLGVSRESLSRLYKK